MANSSMPGVDGALGQLDLELLGGLQLDPVLGQLLDRELAQVAAGAERVEQLHALLDVVVGDHAVVDGERRRVGVGGEPPGRPAASTEIARISTACRIVAPSAGQVPRAVQTRAGQSRSPSSPIPASRTLKPIEVEGGTLVDEV